jgi:uncharacterized protein (DUF885 family)
MNDVKAAFANFLEEYHQERKYYYPLEATFAGDPTYNDRLPNVLTEDYRDSLRAFYQKYQAGLRDIQTDQLDAEEQISYDILAWECDMKLTELTFPTHLMPINQFESLHLYIGQLAAGSSAQPFQTIKDYDNWLLRLQAFTEWCDTAMVNMQKGIADGYVLPRALTVKVIPQMADMAQGPVVEHLYYLPIKNMPETISEAERARLTQAYEAMIGEKIIPTFQRLQSFLETEYLPASRHSSGISDVPRGQDYYKHQIKAFTTTDISADEVFQLGEREVARLRTEMEKVKAQVGFTGDLKAFFEYVRNKPELSPFETPEEVIANFNAIHEKMKPQLKKLFDLTPKTAFEVRRTEAFREASASAEYMQGSIDGSRPGIFYVPLPDVSKYNTFSDEDLFLHEAIPGHHYQVSLQQENEKLPEFRRTLWYSSYGEGWALYCESLGQELGLYTDPYQYFGMLSAEMHRAIRLVVDTGIHTKGWTREQAIQYSLDNEAEPEESIIAEIERYMSWPGQALSYKIGQLKIRELRQKAEQQLGDQFDIRAFHNIVLESGCVPLAVLESKVERWLGESF